MDNKQLSSVDEVVTKGRLVLQPANRAFRFKWLVVGLVGGYIVSLADLPAIGLLVLLAALTGVSANWSS